MTNRNLENVTDQCFDVFTMMFESESFDILNVFLKCEDVILLPWVFNA